MNSLKSIFALMLFCAMVSASPGLSASHKPRKSSSHSSQQEKDSPRVAYAYHVLRLMLACDNKTHTLGALMDTVDIDTDEAARAAARKQLFSPTGLSNTLDIIARTRSDVNQLRNISPVPLSLREVDHAVGDYADTMDSYLDTYKDWIYSNDTEEQGINEQSAKEKLQRAWLVSDPVITLLTHILKDADKTYVKG